VSIDTGVPSLTPFGKNIMEIGQSLLTMATETKKTAKRFAREKARLGDEGRYFRFSVLRGLEDIGLEEYKQKNAIVAATSRYIQSQDVLRQMKACGLDCWKSTIVPASSSCSYGSYGTRTSFATTPGPWERPLWLFIGSLSSLSLFSST
jgi:hypothetical protein